MFDTSRPPAVTTMNEPVVAAWTFLVIFFHRQTCRQGTVHSLSPAAVAGRTGSEDLRRGRGDPFGAPWRWFPAFSQVAALRSSGIAQGEGRFDGQVPSRTRAGAGPSRAGRVGGPWAAGLGVAHPAAVPPGHRRPGDLGGPPADLAAGGGSGRLPGPVGRRTPA